jgi:hypothetical protein
MRGGNPQRSAERQTGERGIRDGTGRRVSHLSRVRVGGVAQRHGCGTCHYIGPVRARAASEGEINGVCRGCFTLLVHGVQWLTYPKETPSTASSMKASKQYSSEYLEPAVRACGNADGSDRNRNASFW